MLSTDRVLATVLSPCQVSPHFILSTALYGGNYSYQYIEFAEEKRGTVESRGLLENLKSREVELVFEFKSL